MLTVQGLESYYGNAHILSDVALTIRPGEVVVLLGRNGAGKSTTIKSIMGFVRPAGGSIHFLGVDVAGRPSHQIARMGLGYVPEERRIFPELTVLENLEVGRQPPRHGAPTWTPERLFELFPNLAERRHNPGGNMSGGEQQMLSVARSLMGNPRLIMLDEPSEGIAPVIVERMAETVKALKSEGLSVLLAEQNMVFANQVSDRAYIIEKGRIRYQGTMEALRGDAQVRDLYLSV